MTKEQLALRFRGVRIFMVRVQELYREGMSPNEVYDVVRWAWGANLEHAQQAEILIGVVGGRIVGAYRITRCDRVGNIQVPSRVRNDPENNDLADGTRIAFEGVQVQAEIQKALGNIVIGDWFDGNRHPTPFEYVNC